MSLLFHNRSNANSIQISENLSEKLLLNHEGKSRTYRIYVPSLLPNHQCATLLLLHGHGGSADQLMGLSGRRSPHRLWMSVADQEKLILIIPDGLVCPDGKRGWNDARKTTNNPDSNDVDFLNKLVETVAKSYPVDPTRLYVSGISNGGHMALRLAAEASEKFAAIAAITAANPDPIFTNKPQKPISVMLMNGTNDRFLPYDGGSMSRERGRVQSTEDSIQYWVAHNNCDKNPTSIQYVNRSRADGCSASLTVYANVSKNVEVALIRILRGGHTAPSIRQPYSRFFLAFVGQQNQDIEMADEIWKFFQDKLTSDEPI